MQSLADAEQLRAGMPYGTWSLYLGCRVRADGTGELDASLFELAQMADIPRHAIAWHLDALVRSGLITAASTSPTTLAIHIH